MTGALAAACLVAGLLLVVEGVRRSGRPSLADRVLPYVRDVHPSSAPAVGPPMADLLAPAWRRLTRVIGESFGTNAAVARRLNRLGSVEDVQDVEAFRVQQAAWGAIGLGAAMAIGLFAWSVSAMSVGVLLLWSAAGLVGGCLACDQRLSARVRAHETDLRSQFPAVAELLALAVAAGESPAAAIERVVRIGNGAMSTELGRVLADVRAGDTIVAALDALAMRTGVTSLARFAESMAVAIERGTPLIEVLHAQAADVRESARRDLIETGGRREIAMMVPVVFLLLPVTIVFAFYPGLVGLHLTSGG